MTTRILLSLITTLAIFATCLEGRYHPEATGLRHHRHDRHRQVWDQDLVPRGSRRREWEETDDDEISIDRQLREKSVGSSSVRRNSDRNTALDHDRRGFGGAGHRGRYDTQRRGRDRYPGRHLRRDYYHRGNSASSWSHASDEETKGRREFNRHTSSSYGRGERSWNYHKPARYDRRRTDEDDDVDGYGNAEDQRRRVRYEDDDEGYEADDEEYYPPRKTSKNREGHFKGRKNRHGLNTWHEDWRRGVDDDDDEEDEDYIDDYDQDYEEYDDEETERRPARRRHGKRVGDTEDFGNEKNRDGSVHSAQNEVTGRRGGKKKNRLFGGVKETREKSDHLNEVEENDEVEEDVWDDAEDGSLDEYDETGTSDFDFDDSKVESSLKTIDDIIRRLTAGDHTTTTPKSTPRRDYRNIEMDNYPPRDRYRHFYDAKTTPKLPPHRMVHRKSENTWETTTPSTTTTTTTTTTTKAPKSYAIFTTELNRVTNSSRNDVGTLVINKKIPSRVEVKKPLVSQLTKTDPDAKTKSLEQDYDQEYENDGSDDKTEDIDDVEAETENEKKWPSEKDQDYNEEENADENDEETEETGSSSNTTVTLLPSTTTMRTTTTPITTTTMSTTTTTIKTTSTPPLISTRAFDSRRSKYFDFRSPVNNIRNFQTTSTAYPPMSNYSAQKWLNLGNRKGVADRRNSGREPNVADMEIRKALLHATQMKTEAVCRLPRPKVVSVREVHHTPSKAYNPSCTILHRCADDTGCCSLEDTCVPKFLHTVELSFYATAVDGTRTIEKLKFVNHTECQCRRRTPPPPPPPPPTPAVKPCKCPSLFTSKITPERGCQCECEDSQPRCIRQRRGKDNFTRTDQWCIKKGPCTVPHCEFGSYLDMAGRCPVKISKFGHKVNGEIYPNMRYRN